MLILLIGSVTLAVCLAIQVLALVLILRRLKRFFAHRSAGSGILADFGAICFVALVAFVGHLLQAGIWAALFVRLDQFVDFQTAFYHSLVNLSSLGYGDLVMNEPWRLLGAMEAASGVLLFGVTAGALVAIINAVFSQSSLSRHPARHDESGHHQDHEHS